MGLRVLIGAALVVGLSGPALAQASKDTLCGESAEIVQLAAEQRASGAGADAVAKDLAQDAAVPAFYRPLVGPIVEWVFAVPKAEVSAKGGPGKLARKYRDNCMSFKP